MSGICGALGDPSRIDDRSLHAMLERMAHRGATESRFASNGALSVGLGHLELDAFAPRGHARRPGFIETSDLVAAMEGCITNRDAIARHAGVDAAATSDVELVCAAYRRFGNDAIRMLDGPFSLALWDRSRHRMLLSRDKLGERSLFFHHDPATQNVAFATEIKSILGLPGMRRELDRQSLSLHLAFGYVPGPKTLLANVYKLLPGECVVIDAGRPPERLRYYTIPEITDSDISEPEAIATLRELFMRGLERYLTGCTDVGVFLSGGIDSTILVAAMRELGVPRISTFTIGFTADADNPQTDDLHYAQLVASQYATDHHEIIVDAAHDPHDRLLRVIRQFDNLVMTPNSYSKCVLAEAVRDAGVRSVVTGSAAAGACGIHRQFLQQKWRHKWVRSTRMCNSDEERYYRLRGGLFQLSEQRRLLQDGPSIDVDYIVGELQHYVGPVQAPDFFRRFLFSNLMITSTEKSMRVLDEVCGMASVECRSPYVDRDLVEYSTRLPESFDGGETFVSLKTHMEKAFEAELPPAVRERAVIGYPAYYWGNGELSALQKRLLSREALLENGIFSPEGVAVVLEADREAKLTGKSAWALTQFLLWYEVHVKDSQFDLASK